MYNGVRALHRRKKKIVRIVRTSTTVSSHPVRLEITGESTARLLALPIAIAPRLTDAGRREIEPAWERSAAHSKQETGNKSVRCGFGFWQSSHPVRAHDIGMV